MAKPDIRDVIGTAPSLDAGNSRGASHIVLINDFSVARGGATTLALELAHRLLDARRAVTFFAGDDGNNPALAEAGADIVALNGARLLDSQRTSALTGLYDARVKRALSSYIERRDGADVVYHVHVWSQIFSPSIFAALRPVAARTVITAHDFFLACPNGTYTNYPQSKPCALTPMSASCLLTQCDKRSYPHKLWRAARLAGLRAMLNLRAAPFTIVAIQEGMVAMLERGGVPAERVVVVKNPADGFSAERVEAERNREVVFLGRLEREKGADLLAAAARKAGMPLRVIGEGPDAETVKRANPDAQFDGWLTKEEIGARLKSARLLAMPSRCTEPFGLAAAEALRVGVPVIASRSSLIVGDLERLGAGLGVDVMNVDEFAAALGALSADDARVAAMSRAAFDHAGAIAQSFDEWTAAHLALYDRLAGAARAG
ncbi:MAG: glycosyltransferase family 4 protein [Amphiplicatus sp.]